MQLQIFLMGFIVIAIYSEPKEFMPKKTWLGLTPLAWIDGRNREIDGAVEVDTFFDRIVSIAYFFNKTETFSNAATGVLVTPELVLTSFNAFAALSKNKDARQQMIITYLEGRRINDVKDPTTRSITYIPIYINIECGRQVIPNLKETVISHMKQETLHDLMVLRLVEPAKVLNPVPKPMTEMKVGESYENGAILTIIAGKDDAATDNLRFASVGHISDAHIKDSRYLEKEEIHPDDDAIADCEEWIPREWGRFICIRNINNYPGIASGAMLFSGDKLVGVGAFALWKGDLSVFIFTDVRPYKDLILKTCTKDDVKLVP